MGIECANCHGRFTLDQVKKGTPPNPPKSLSREGEPQLLQNQTQDGNHHRCPACGNQTLRPAAGR